MRIINKSRVLETLNLALGRETPIIDESAMGKRRVSLIDTSAMHAPVLHTDGNVGQSGLTRLNTFNFDWKNIPDYRGAR